jgi:hypothetical protein
LLPNFQNRLLNSGRMMMIAKIHGSNVDSIITIVKSQIISKKIEMILVTKTIKTG